MELIVDRGIHSAAIARELQQFLALAPDTPIHTDLGSLPPLRGQVLLVTNLDAGGRNHQCSLIRDSDAVDQWFILSQDTAPETLEVFRLRVRRAAGQVHLFSDREALKEALARPVVQKNSCLLCTVKAGVEVSDLARLLADSLPGWDIRQGSLDRDPALLETTTCSQVILAGQQPQDLRWRGPIPAHIKPLLVLTQAETQLWDETIHRKAAGSLSALAHWSESLQKEHLFLLSTHYEQLRRRVRAEPQYLDVLQKQTDFVMWDEYRLPQPPEAYTKENIARFLARFNGLQALVRRLTGSET